MNFSVLISLYNKERPDFLNQALLSLHNQTLLPYEIVIVYDGPITNELEEVVELYSNKSEVPYQIIKLKVNQGLGIALNKGLEFCKCNLVARMDTDDICESDRFEKQISFFKSNKEVSAMSGTILEFSNDPNHIINKRTLPLTSKELNSFAKYRNPLNHMAVMFKKSDILSVGGYKAMASFEDYYLWIRLLLKNKKLANINVPLIKARTNQDQLYLRRSGLTYFRHEIFFLKTIYNEGFYNFFEFFLILSLRTPLRLLPLNAIKFIYKYFLRKAEA